MRSRGLAALGLGLGLLLGACGGETTTPPAALVPIDTELEPERLWERDVGAGSGERYLALRPAAAGEVVYAASRDGTVVAMEAATGERIWSTDTELPVTGGVGLAPGKVLLGTGDARVVALDAGSGERLWTSPVSSEVLAPPAGGRDLVAARTVDGKIFALSAGSGERRWRYDGGVPVLTLRGTGAPVIVDGTVVAGFDNGKLVALDAADGRQLWETAVAVPGGRSELERMVDVDGTPSVVESNVYAAAFQGRVVAVALESGQILWAREISVHDDVGVAGDVLYVTDDGDNVWALDRRTGASLWKQDKLPRRRVTAPVSFGEYVVVGDLDGYVHWM
ncbi:MAG: outer membrane protein assembly factor BamB, partial [Gammaproteobacteria bacterium]|nr:outer membrane protein assembly factor BamB [Gammaproteobacteria bacterium]